MRLARFVALSALLALAAGTCAEVRETVFDPLTTADHWQLGGQRINYVLGESSVTASGEQTREGAKASLKLTYDFDEPRRDYLSAYHTGPSLPGLCRQVSFWVYGNACEGRLRLSLEDTRGRWFERDLGPVDWEGWQRVSVPIADGEGWRPLLRLGEEALPVLQPVNLRQIAVFRVADMATRGALFFQDLRASTDIVAADLVRAEITTGRPANLFDADEKAALLIELTSDADQPVRGRLLATISDFFGTQVETDLGAVSLEPGAKLARTLPCPTDRLGTYDVAVRLQAADRERLWLARFAVTRSVAPRPPDPDALFGCMYSLEGFSREQWPLVMRLNRDAGIRWARTGFAWGEINPAPGVWAWDGPSRVEGPVGQALAGNTPALRLPHSPVLDCPDAVTIAFWAQGTEANGAWQTPLQKWGPSNRRNYGVYFHLRDGSFCFSASYEKLPDVGWRDFSSGFSAWDGRWHHYAASYDREAREVVLYVDGEVKASADHDGGRLRTNPDDLVLSSGCPAALDEMLLYRRALTAAEVAALAAKGSPPRDGLVGWWSFEGTGTTLADSSGNGLDVPSAQPAALRMARTVLEAGVQTLGLLGFPPRWASTAPEGAARPHVHKPDLRAWAEFVEQTARHYRDLVQHWEIWNEPNITAFWEPTPDPREFLDVVRTGYEAAKRGNPDCTVIMPGLAGPGQNRHGMDFLDELLKLGAARFCDAISIHPYRQATPEESDLVGDLRHIVDLARAHGGERRLWFTENCWTTQVPGGSTERRQALMLPRCYLLSLGSGLMERFIWFRLHDPGVDRFYTEHNYGMCYNDLTPKPAYFAHRTVALLLEKARPDGEWDVGPRALARCFRTDTDRVAAVWSPESPSPVSLFVGLPEARLVNIMGNERTVPTEDGVVLLEADEAVIFLRGLPDEAEGRGTVLAGTAPALTRQGQGRLTLRLRNPFPGSQRVALRGEAAPGLALAPASLAIDVPAEGEAEATLDLSAAGDADPGWHEVRVTARLAGRDFLQTIPVAVRSAPPDAGPVGYWKLDEGQGTVLTDSSGEGNDGTVEAPQWVEGRTGTGLRFDGRHIAVIPDAPSLNLRDEVTVAFWIKTEGDTGTWQFPVTKYFQENIRRNYGIYLRPGTLAPAFSASFERGTYLHTDVGTTVALNDGRWHHLAATYSVFDRRVRVYVDGRLATGQTTDLGRLLLTTDPVRFGSGTIGVLDEVGVWPRALTAEEIADLAR